MHNRQDTKKRKKMDVDALHGVAVWYIISRSYIYKRKEKKKARHSIQLLYT